ncbi:MAG: type II toxin-antitoxin system RelE/ParE family toxin [Thermoanaerobaculia bacterium]
MPASLVRFHPNARDEAYRGVEYYRERSPIAAERFGAAIEHAVAVIADSPERWPRHLFGTRRYVFSGFPYSLVYRVGQKSVEVYAVAHAKRRPGYWRRRKF